HYGVAEGWLSFQGAILIILAHSAGTTACMLAARRRSRARAAQNFQLFFDLCVLAFGVPLDPNPGLPLLFVFYLAFLDLGVRYGFHLYRRQTYGAMLALAIAISIRAFVTTGGFSLLDGWAVLLFVAILLYGLQVFAIRERTFRALKEAQERLHLSLGAPGVCTWSTDDPLQNLEPGANFRRVTGIPPEQFSDRMADYIALIHPEDRERVVRHYTRFVQEPVDEYEDEYRILGVDGMLRTVNVRARAERAANGRARSVSGILWDISEQIRQREALALMQERYRLATGAARVGVWIWNVADREFEIDESLRTLFGLETHVNANDGRLRLGQDDFFMLIHPDDRPQHALYISSLLDTDTTEYFREFRIPLETGEVRDIQARGTIFRNAQGRIQRVAGVAW
ncbi:MAG: PAS domain-containing protein, partial [Nevskiales bacterium]